MMLRMKRCVIYYICLFILYTKTMTYSYPDSGNGNLPPYSYLQASFHQPYCLDRNEPGKEPPRSNKATRMYLNEFRGGGSSYAGIGRPANIDNNDEDVRSTRSSKFLGKDREVVHLNVDLKWIWSKITDRNTYLGIINHWWGIATKAFDRWSGRQEFKDICIDILLHIRSVNLDTKIRVFHGSIVTAARFAANTNRLLLLYIEDGDSREPSSHSTFFRNALSNSTLGNIINEKFVFYVSATRHKATRKLSRKLFREESFPILSVLRPSLEIRQLLIDSTLRVAPADVTAEVIQDFLRRSIDKHMLQLFVGDISNSLEDGSSHATDVDVDVDDGRETESIDHYDEHVDVASFPAKLVVPPGDLADYKRVIPDPDSPPPSPPIFESSLAEVEDRPDRLSGSELDPLRGREVSTVVSLTLPQSTDSDSDSDLPVGFDRPYSPPVSAAVLLREGQQAGTKERGILQAGNISTPLFPAPRPGLIAVAVNLPSGIQLRHHFHASDTLQTVANWGRSSRAVADEPNEELVILSPPVRFTPANLKRTLLDLKLPRFVQLNVVTKQKRPQPLAVDALQCSGGGSNSNSSKSRLMSGNSVAGSPV